MSIKLIQDCNPENLEAALAWVARYCERKDAVSSLGLNSRVEVPMEVGSARPITSSPSDHPTQEVSALLKKVLNCQENISSKIAKLEAANSPRGFHRPNINYGQFGTEGARKSQLPHALPVCYRCDVAGHIQRECPVLQRPRRFFNTTDVRQPPEHMRASPTEYRPSAKQPRSYRMSAVQSPHTSQHPGNYIDICDCGVIPSGLTCLSG
ncbi:hypothetical protein NP493_1111g00001 [Ridgeia piscesae]|uniref:CCHC-type domain-containing protein n=1 Tax=Ridgeia piscesae TaxID=27915 RepID=A0AAD9NJP2_RIDPI|nr:hypothetical protein NP493_1111g00001 [Ridgeia piscesae]